MMPADAGWAGPTWGAGNNGLGVQKSLQTGRFACVRRRRAAPYAAAAAWLLLASCGGNPEPVPEAAPYADPGFAEAGHHRLHYALTMTHDLPSGIAGSYGIVPRRNLALLTITLMPRDSNSLARTGASEIEATAVTLTGERHSLPLARHDEAGGPTWLATVEVRHRVPVAIEIRARATVASPEIRVRLMREFRLE